MIDVFISHSSQDAALAEALVDLLRTSLNIRAALIRCTSVDGYRLPIGADADEQLRQEVFEAKAFVGILSLESIASTYVLFELGARWGAKKHLAPLLASGLSAHALKGPLVGLNALSCESVPQLQQFIQDMGRVLNVTPEEPQVYQAKIEALVYAGSAVSAQTFPPPSAALPKAQDQHPPVKRGNASDTDGHEYADAEAVIRHHCEKEWPDDFSMRAYCIEQQRDALNKLKEGSPQNVPNDVFKGIRQKCASEWPDDYAMRVYCESQQLEGYRRVTEKP